MASIFLSFHIKVETLILSLKLLVKEKSLQVEFKIKCSTFSFINICYFLFFHYDI